MDIKSKAVLEVGRLVLRDSSDEVMVTPEGKEVAIIVYGPGSKPFAKAQAAQNSRMLDKLRRKGKVEQTAEQKTAEAAEFLTDCTKEFENIEYDDLSGRELFRAVYSDITLGFIADQVAKFIGDWANFTKGYTKN